MKFEDHLSHLVMEIISHNLPLQQVQSLANITTRGDCWLIGGSLYQNLAYYLYPNLYDSPPEIKDFDITASRIVDFSPSGWEVSRSRFGSHKLKKDGLTVDMSPLEMFRRFHPNPLQGYIIGVPLTIQAIAYNLNTGEIYGRPGIVALETRTVSINNAHELETVYAPAKKLTPEECLMKHANRLNFKFT